jgi:Arc/MetJ family transcription regulator
LGLRARNKFVIEKKCVYLFKFMCMRTNIDIDDRLMAKAQKLTNITTKKAVVKKALELLVTIENQKRLLELWGNVAIDDKAYE